MKFYMVCVFISLCIHFHHPSEIFHRSLLNYDDKQFIEPLSHISLLDYPSQWLFGKDHYGFPLKDLTFYVDFFIKDTFGISTFCFFNWIFYLIGMFFLLKIFRLVFKQGPELLWTLVFFHPTHVEFIQWPSNRKHLLVMMFINIGTYLVLRIKKDFSKKDMIIILCCYLCSILCWPSGALWIFFPILFIVLSFSSWSWQKKTAICSLLYFLFYQLIQFYLDFLGSNNSHYQDRFSDLVFDLDQLKVAFLVLFSSLGRGIFTIFFPIQMEPYYHITHIYNKIGLAICAFLCVFYLLSFFKKKETKEYISEIFFLIGFLLFIPIGKIFFNSVEFVWADRYTFFVLPYFFISFLYKYSIKINRFLYVFYILFFLYQSFQSQPRWIFDGDLFEKCSFEEKSFKCLFFAVEKKYDQMGCKNLDPIFALSRKASLEEEQKKDIKFFSFENQLPFYESLCIAESSFSFKEKEEKIREIRNFYENPFFQTIGEIMILLSDKRVDQALSLAKEQYLNERVKIPDTGNKMINIITGQLDLLCTLEELLNKKILNCKDHIGIFTSRIGKFQMVEKQKSWGFQKSMDAYNH